MAAGHVPSASIPGWPNPAVGVYDCLEAALFQAGFSGCSMMPEGLWAGDVAFADNFLSTYVGSTTELEWHRTQLQAQLDTNLNNNFNLIAFIRAGTISTLTGTNVANFLANSSNNYRKLRDQISSATTIAQLQAVNINAGWPSNP